MRLFDSFWFNHVRLNSYVDTESESEEEELDEDDV